MYYNFVRIHQTLRATPAKSAGVTDRLGNVGDTVALLDSGRSAKRDERAIRGRSDKCLAVLLDHTD